MLSRLRKYSEKKELIGFIVYKDANNFDVDIINSSTEEKVTSLKYSSEKCKTFMDELSSMKNVFKAVIVDLFYLDLRHIPYQVIFEYCKELRKLFRRQEIPSVFITYEVVICSSYLIASKIDFQFDETVLFVLTHTSEDAPSQTRTTFGVTTSEFKFTPNGYQLIKHRRILSLNLKDKPELLHEQICGDSSSPTYVIVPSYKCNRIPFKKIFKSNNLFLMNEAVENFQTEFMIETFKWLMDKSYTKYHIIPTSARGVHVYGFFGKEKNALDILKIDAYDPLPFSKLVVHSRSFPKYFINFKTQAAQYGHDTTLPAICHAYQTSVNIDEDNFDLIETGLLFIEDFNKVPSKLNDLLPSKIPFIAFIDQFSVLATYKESKGYEFLEEWNGIYGVDCFISFDQKKPKFGKDAMKTVLTKNSFVVFDLIKIMSMPSDDIQIQKTWGFKITKDKNNPVLLQFDTFDGTIKEASPAFLMALFLRQHLKAIQEENDDGEKPKEIAIWIPKQKFNDEEYTRIQEGISKSCELLKLEFCFLDAGTFNYALTKDDYGDLANFAVIR